MWQLRTDPAPRVVAQPYVPFEWKVGEQRALSITDGQELASMTSTLEDRNSARTFSPISSDQLGPLLWHAARTKQSALSPLGLHIEHRLAPSGGGIHPIHLIIQLPDESGWARYNPQAHSLDVLVDANTHLSPLIDHGATVLPRGGGRLVLFVAEFGKTAAKYERPESVVWRDAGILQGSLGLVAASLGLNYCLLGITGNPWVARLSNEGKLQGVGMAILGRRP